LGLILVVVVFVIEFVVIIIMWWRLLLWWRRRKNGRQLPFELSQSHFLVPSCCFGGGRASLCLLQTILVLLGGNP
jgi:hypothetical protein